MTKLSATQFSTKVVKSFYLNTAVTLIVGFVSQTPLSNNLWLSWLQDSTVCLALLTLLSALVGYTTEEKAYD